MHRSGISEDSTKKGYNHVIDTEIWFTLPDLVQRLYDHIKGHKHVYLWACTEILYNFIKASW